MTENYTIKYKDEDGIYDWYECRAEDELHARSMFDDWCDEIGERLTFINVTR
jgi:hypothetical protein